MAETAETVVRVKTEGMAETAVMQAQAPTQMAEMAEMEAQTGPMEGMVATEEVGIIHPAVMVVMAVMVVVMVVMVVMAAAYNS